MRNVALYILITRSFDQTEYFLVRFYIICHLYKLPLSQDIENSSTFEVVKLTLTD